MLRNEILTGAGHSKHEDCVVRSEPGTIDMKHPAALHGGYPTTELNILVSMQLMLALTNPARAR